MSKEKFEAKTKSGVTRKDSIKTKLSLVMILVVAIPLITAIVVSYNSSTKKAMADAQDSLEWQAWYMEDMFTSLIDK